MFLSCEEDPIFGLERGWLRNEDSNAKQDDNESENDEDSGVMTKMVILVGEMTLQMLTILLP